MRQGPELQQLLEAEGQGGRAEPDAGALVDDPRAAHAHGFQALGAEQGEAEAHAVAHVLGRLLGVVQDLRYDQQLQQKPGSWGPSDLPVLLSGEGSNTGWAPGSRAEAGAP